MQNINRDQLNRMNQWDKEDFVLINVLAEDVFNKKHIRTSINIPHDDSKFTEMVEKVAGKKERKVVVYCASFDCEASKKAAEKLEHAGFSQVYDYEGGTKDWFDEK